MNNTCPKCGSAYSLKPEYVGRKLTCKNCGANLIVTTAGLEFRSDTGPVSSPKLPPPPPPPAHTEEAHDYGRDDGPPDDRDRDDYDDDGGDRDRPRKRKRRRSGGGSFWGDFFAFRRMIVPSIIQILFILGLIICVVYGLFMVILAVASGRVEAIGFAFLYAAISVPLGMLMTRIYCELLILGFRINDTLTDIHDELRRQRRS